MKGERGQRESGVRSNIPTLERNVIVMNRLKVMLVMLIAGCSATSLPSDVLRFTERREDCDHLRGEVSDEVDQKGRTELEVQLKKSCEGTDHELARLRVKHMKNQMVIDLLSKYPTRIEAH